MLNATTPHHASPSIRQLIRSLSTAQKSNLGAPGYSRWINRPAGRVLAAIACRLGMTPNQVTTCSAIVSFAGIALIAAVPTSPVLGVIVALLLMLAYALDSADGQLARLRGGGSPNGEWLDHVVDCTKSSAIHLAVLICWFRFFHLEHPSLMLVPIVFCLQSAVWFFTIILTEHLRTIHTAADSKSQANPREHAPYLRSIIMLPADYGVLCISFFLLGTVTGFVTLYSTLMVCNVAFLIVALRKWYKSLSAP